MEQKQLEAPLTLAGADEVVEQQPMMAQVLGNEAMGHSEFGDRDLELPMMAEAPGIESMGHNEFADRNLELLAQLGMLGPSPKALKAKEAKKRKKKKKSMLLEQGQLRRTARAIKMDDMSEKALEKKSMKCTRCGGIGHTVTNCDLMRSSRWGEPSRVGLRQRRGRVRYNYEQEVMSEESSGEVELMSEESGDRSTKRSRTRAHAIPEKNPEIPQPELEDK